MSLIKNIQDKNFVALKDYVDEKIASIVVDKIQSKKSEFISKIRGMSEKVEIVIKDDNKKDDKESKEKDKADDKDEDNKSSEDEDEDDK